RQHTRPYGDWSSNSCSSELDGDAEYEEWIFGAPPQDVEFVLDDCVPNEADKLHILRRSAEDPFFVFGVAIMLADLLIGASLRERDQFAVHSHQYSLFLERLLHLRRQRVHVGFASGKRLEVEHRLKIFFELL